MEFKSEAVHRRTLVADAGENRQKIVHNISSSKGRNNDGGCADYNEEQYNE